MAGKIIIEKPPVANNPKGYPKGIASATPWTDAQRTAGMRREVPLGSTGIGTNRVAPPPPPAPRINFANLLAQNAMGNYRSDGGGQQWNGPGWGNAVGWGSGAGNRGGYTTSAPGWGGGNSSAGAGYGMGGGMGSGGLGGRGGRYGGPGLY